MGGFHLSHFAGVVFAIGWWVWIDCWVLGKLDGSIPASNERITNSTTSELTSEPNFDAYWALGTLSTVGCLILNTIGWTALTATDAAFGASQAATLRCRALVVLFLSVLCFVGAIGGSVWMLVIWAKTGAHVVLSICLLVQNLLIAFSAALLRADGNPQVTNELLLGANPYGT